MLCFTIKEMSKITFDNTNSIQKQIFIDKIVNFREFLRSVI